MRFLMIWKEAYNRTKDPHNNTNGSFPSVMAMAMAMAIAIANDLLHLGAKRIVEREKLSPRAATQDQRECERSQFEWKSAQLRKLD
jgi:hypothetical protein